MALWASRLSLTQQPRDVPLGDCAAVAILDDHHFRIRSVEGIVQDFRLASQVPHTVLSSIFKLHIDGKQVHDEAIYPTLNVEAEKQRRCSIHGLLPK